MTYDDIIISVEVLEKAKKRLDSAVKRKKRTLAAILKMFKDITRRAGDNGHECGGINCGSIVIGFCVNTVSFCRGDDWMEINNQLGDYQIHNRGHESFVAEVIEKAPEYARMYAETIKENIEEKADEEESKREMGLWK